VSTSPPPTPCTHTQTSCYASSNCNCFASSIAFNSRVSINRNAATAYWINRTFNNLFYDKTCKRHSLLTKRQKNLPQLFEEWPHPQPLFWAYTVGGRRKLDVGNRALHSAHEDCRRSQNQRHDSCNLGRRRKPKSRCNNRISEEGKTEMKIKVSSTKSFQNMHDVETKKSMLQMALK